MVLLEGRLGCTGIIGYDTVGHSKIHLECQVFYYYISICQMHSK